MIKSSKFGGSGGIQVESIPNSCRDMARRRKSAERPGAANAGGGNYENMVGSLADVLERNNK